MKIGKFRMELQYDIQCDKCGEYRSNIGWLTFSLSQKPSSAILKQEGWEYKEGIGQMCPRCTGKGVFNRLYDETGAAKKVAESEEV